MTGKPENPPAFPCAEDHKIAADLPWTQGMTLRDWFAGQALAALPGDLRERQTDHRIKIAEWCYGQADAMLTERTKPHG